MTTKTFRVIDPADCSNVLGGDVPEGNSHLTNLAPIAGQPALSTLTVDENSKCRWIIGDRGIVFTVWRIS